MINSTTEKRPLAVDLFAGAGGLSLAAIKSGFEICAAVENDTHSAETYRQNICKLEGGENTTIYEEDIRCCDIDLIQKTHFSQQGCDLLLGGPPCQGFSTHRILDAGIDDPRNDLILTYFEFIKWLKPRMFLMENVPGILWERHKPYLDKFYAEAASAGYNVPKPVVIDARDFGVPQRRRRVFILGMRGDLAPSSSFVWPPPPTHCDPEKAAHDKLPWVSCAHVFRNLPEADANNLHMQHGPELIRAFENTPANGGSRRESGRILKCHQEHDGHKDVYGRIDPNAPAPTMTTACINPSKGRFVHPTEHHGITTRQAARIQTFPDSYVFHGGLTASGRQIGNAVPIDLGQVLIGHILIELASATHQKLAAA